MFTLWLANTFVVSYNGTKYNHFGNTRSYVNIISVYLHITDTVVTENYQFQEGGANGITDEKISERD